MVGKIRLKIRSDPPGFADVNVCGHVHVIIYGGLIHYFGNRLVSHES